MRTDAFLFRAKRFAALTILASLAGIPMASQASSKPTHGQRTTSTASKETDTTDLVAQTVPGGDPFPFLVSPAVPGEYQIQVPYDAQRLTLKFQVAGSGSVDAYLKFGSSPGKTGSNRAELFYRAVTGSASFDILPQSVPPLGDGTYHLRLESAVPAGGFFVAMAVPAAARNRENPPPPAPPFLAALALLPRWVIAALWVAPMTFLGLVFLHGIGSARSHAKDIRAALDSLGLVAASLGDLKKSIADLPEALADYLPVTAAPAASMEEAPAPPLRR
jgi:hypothetical protein